MKENDAGRKRLEVYHDDKDNQIFVKVNQGYVNKIKLL